MQSKNLSLIVCVSLSVFWTGLALNNVCAAAEIAPQAPVSSHSVADSALPEDVAAKLSLPPLPDYALPLKKVLADPKPEEALKNRTEADIENSPFLKTAREWQSAMDHYRTPENEDVQKAKTEIRLRMTALEKVFNANRTQGNTWKKLLNWDVFAREIRKQGLPDMYVLSSTFSKLSSGAYGLEMECFASLRLAIQNYVTLMTVRAKPEESKEMYQQVCKMLVVLMAEAEKNPHADTQRAVEGCLRWMDWTGQAKEQVATTRQLWSNPNTVVNITEFLFERYGTHPMNEPQTIREQVGQASISGNATFTGELKIFPVPNSQKAEIRIQLDGHSQGSTVAHQSVATVRSNSQSTINAAKTVTFDHRGFTATRAKANITTDSQITSVGVSGRAGQGVAERRAYEQKNQTARTLSQRNAARIESRMNQALDGPIKKANDSLYGDVRRQLEPRGVDLSKTRAQTDDKRMYIYSPISTLDGLMAATPPPAMTYENDPADIQISVHESTIQNICSGFFAGLLLDEQAAKNFQQTAPEWLLPAEDSAAAEDADTEKPAIEFSSQMPVTVSFTDGKVLIVVAGKQFINNGKAYPALRIAMAYRLVQENGKFFFVRDGEFELLPPGFDPEVDKQLSSSVTTIRRVMTRQLKEQMPEKVEIETIPLAKKDEQPKQTGTGAFQMKESELRPIFVGVRDGWLQLGYRLEPVE